MNWNHFQRHNHHHQQPSEHGKLLNLFQSTASQNKRKQCATNKRSVYFLLEIKFGKVFFQMLLLLWYKGFEKKRLISSSNIMRLTNVRRYKRCNSSTVKMVKKIMMTVEMSAKLCRKLIMGVSAKCHSHELVGLS